jgi:aminopeptidase N
MLRQLLGEKVYEAGARLYFSRYNGGNANTRQFLACFEEASGQSLADFSREWLFTVGYPQVAVRYAYDPASRELRLQLRQTRAGTGGVFTMPFSFAAVDAKGRDIPGTVQTIRLDEAEAEVVLAGIAEPAFLSINRDAGFYGTCADLSATPEQLVRQVRSDASAFNRVEAMRRLTDLERHRLLAQPAAAVSADWLDLFRRLLTLPSLSDGIRGYLLKIDEQPFDRALLPRVRESYTVRQRLLRAAAQACGEGVLIAALRPPPDDRPSAPDDLPAAIERRFLKNAVLQLLSGLNTHAAHAALEEHLAQSANITDLLNTLAALGQSRHPARRAILAREGETLRQTLGGYLGYLQVVGTCPFEEVFDAVAEEERRPTFSLSHPGLSRSLYVPLSLNNAQLWTPRGLRWLTDTVIKLAPVSEFTTLRIVAPCQAHASFAPDLRAAVQAALREMLAAVRKQPCPSVTGRLEAYLR